MNKNIKARFSNLHECTFNLRQVKQTEAVVRRCSSKVVLRNFTKFTGKHLRQGLFFNKVAGLDQLYFYTP